MYKVAILGCENSHANNFLDAVINGKIVDDIEFVGVYSYDTEAAAKLHDKFGVYVAKSYDEFVGKVDGIIITARHGDHHYEYAKPYLASGIPMFIDKPITCTEEDAAAFMADLKRYQIPVSGGSVCVLADHIQNLKKVVAEQEYGKVLGGFLRAPVNMRNSYGGFYFYSQHLVQVMMEIFGNYPNSVQVVNNGDTYTCLVRYDEYDVNLEFVDGNYVYYAGVSCEKDYVGASYNFDGLFKNEFMEFYNVLTGGAQKHSYEDFFAPVYVINALKRAIESGCEEKVHRMSSSEFLKDKLQVKAFQSRKIMGEVAAADIVAAIKEKLAVKEEINMIFAAAPSQNDVLKALVESDVEWNRVNAYHMDEYIGLDKTAPQSFGNFLMDHIFGQVPFKSVNLIDCEAANPEIECERYAKLLAKNPADIIVMGIGENGHIAFNDPWVADFKDSRKVKVVLLDEVCRQQQVNDGCFEALEQVPKQAITLTCPVFMEAPQLFCIVPAITKAQAVRRTICGKINEECPATVLREHPAAVLYLDADSASLL